MLSRVAENLYWLSRYVERAENAARLLDVGFFVALDASGLGGDELGGGPLDGILAIFNCRDDFERHKDEAGHHALLRFLTFDRDNPHSIVRMIARARENARGAQETVGAESWSQINRLYLYLSGPKAQRRFQASPSRFYGGIKHACILFAGLLDSTQPRDEVFHFLQIGRHLERVDQMARIVGVRSRSLVGPEAEAEPRPLQLIHWTSLLRSCSAYEGYLRTYRDRIDPSLVIRYLVLDPDFPRALRFCVARCRESLHDVGGGDADAYGSEAERLLGRLDGELHYIHVGEIFDRGLPDFLHGVQQACARVGDEIHAAYFST